MPPPLHTNSIVRPAPHPSALTGSHLPPGEVYSQKFRAGSSESMAPPTRREAAPRKFLRIKFVGVPPPLQAPSLASLKSHFHPQIVSLTFKVPSLFGGADVLIYRHKVRRGRGADAGERSPDEPTAHPRDRPPSGVFIDVFSFLFLFSGGRVSSLPPIFLLDITIEPRYNMNRTSIHRGERCET